MSSEKKAGGGSTSYHPAELVAGTLDLECERWSRPRKVRVVALSGEDLVVTSRRGSPRLEEVVQLRTLGARGASAMVTGRVVGLELVRSGVGGTRITVELLEPSPALLADLQAAVEAGRSETTRVGVEERVRRAPRERDTLPPLAAPKPGETDRPRRRRDDRGSKRPRRSIEAWAGSSQPTQRARARRSGESAPVEPEGGSRRDDAVASESPPRRRLRRLPTGTGYSIMTSERTVSRRRRRSRDSDGAGARGVPRDEGSRRAADDDRRPTDRASAATPAPEERADRPTPPRDHGAALAESERRAKAGDDASPREEERRASAWDFDVPDELSFDDAAPSGASQSADGALSDAAPVVDDLAAALRESSTGLDPSSEEALDEATDEQPEEAPASAPGRRAERRGGRELRQVSARAERAGAGLGALLGRSEAPIVGIDFGTSYSKVAVLDMGEVVLIEDTQKSSATRATVPSVVALDKAGRFIVGEDARDMLAMHPERVISSVKRILGLKYDDPLANGLLASLACETVEGPNGSILFEIDGQSVTVPEVVSKILEHLVGMATRWAGAPVKQAVLTIPVDFDKAAKRELELAAKMAGLEVMAMVPEPVAAVMGCGFGGAGSETMKVAVYDFGGGTFDATIVEVGSEKFEVLGAAGDRWLGGDDLDDALARHVADRFLKEKQIRLHNRREEFQRLLFACEEGKRLLSTLSKVEIIMPEAGITEAGEQVLLIPIERDDFDDLAQDVVSSSLVICQQAAAEAGIDPTDVDALLVTGGTTRVPVVHEAARTFFEHECLSGIHPEHAVVIGAAVRAAVISGERIPDDIGNRLRGYGVTGRDVGIAMADGSTEHVIRADQPPPVAAGRFFRAQLEEGASYALELVEGPSRRAEENRPIGNFIIEGLPVGPDGTVVINIYFELGTTGTLYVTAQDRLSGRRVQATFDLAED